MDVYHEGDLHVAALVGAVDVVKGLLEQGVSPNLVTDEYDKSPLHFVLGLGFTEENFFDQPPLENRIQVVKLLLDNGCDIDSKDSSGRTPLMTSIRSPQEDNVTLARLLLEHGADPLIQDKDGYTSFHHACDFKRPDMLALLIAHGPPVSEFPVGKDRRTLLHLVALCSKKIFKSALESTPIDFINTTCINEEGKILDEMLSLPCCLIQNRDLDGLEALLKVSGIKKSVLTCPIVSELCRGVYSPVGFAFVKDTFSDFSFRTIQLYVDHNLPLDPDYSEDVRIFSFGDADVLTCMEILVDVHEFHLGNNLETSCKCAKLFILLLKKGACLKSYNPSYQDIISTRVLKFLCLYGSVFGLAYLLKYSYYLEPYNLLSSFISLITSNTRLSVSKHKGKIIDFLVSLSSPEDIIEIRRQFSHLTHPLFCGIVNSLSYVFVEVPSLKCLSRAVVRKQCHIECLNQPNDLCNYFSKLPLPKPLISYLLFSDLISSLKSHPDYPSFLINFIP